MVCCVFLQGEEGTEEDGTDVTVMRSLSWKEEFEIKEIMNKALFII